MRVPFLSALLLLPFLLYSGSQTFGGPLDDAKLALHVQPLVPPSKSCLQSPPAQGLPCSQFSTQGDLGAAYTVYLLVANVEPTEGVDGLSCGIEYNPAPGQGVDVFGWYLCADGIETRFGLDPNDYTTLWPASGGGDWIGWNTCQSSPVPGYEGEGALAVAGAFYVYAYSADSFTITENRNVSPGELTAWSCPGPPSDLQLSAVGFAKFSTGAADAGCNPCIEPCNQDSVCLVAPPSVFITAPAGGVGEESFDIQNVSEEVIAGDIRLPGTCTIFNITGGGGPFTLEPGDIRTVTVQYPFNGCNVDGEVCLLETGNAECGRVRLQGFGNGYSCDISPTEIDFGEVTVGQSSQRTFAVQNDGCAAFDWTFSVECEGFEVVGGQNINPVRDAPGWWHLYLLRGEMATIDVQFTPAASGFQECALTVEGLHYDCGPVLFAGASVGELQVPLDLYPGSCDNPMNPVKKGVLPAALLGSADFDVSLIDPNSVRLMGVASKKTSVEDTSTPPDEPCGCPGGPDGYPDLTLKFLAPAVFEAIGPVMSGEAVRLTLTGQLLDGTPFQAEDCLTVVSLPTNHDPTEEFRLPDGLVLVGVSDPRARVQNLQFGLPTETQVRIAVFDVSGRLIEELMGGVRGAGYHEVDWDSTGRPNGMYFVRMETAQGTVTRKVMLAR